MKLISFGWLNVDCLNKIKTQKKILRKIKENTQRSGVVTQHNITLKMNWFSYISVINQSANLEHEDMKKPMSIVRCKYPI